MLPATVPGRSPVRDPGDGNPRLEALEKLDATLLHIQSTATDVEV